LSIRAASLLATALILLIFGGLFVCIFVPLFQGKPFLSGFGFAFFVPLAALLCLPWLLSRILDPAAIRAIRTYCEERRLEVIKVTVFSAHWGVRFRKNGKSYYSRCAGFRPDGTLVWKGKPPDELVESQAA